MKKVLFGFVIVSVGLLIACGGNENNGKEGENDGQNTTAQNDRCLDFAITEKYGSLDPIRVTDVASFHITSQIFEPLLRFDEKNLSLKPLLATAWEVADDNITHTFSLKKGIRFHDNDCFEGGEGRELKAKDVVYTFQRIFSSIERRTAPALAPQL